MRPLTIGVTGGIASGKSAVALEFAKLGIPWVDADIIAREIVEPGEPALADIAERFGPEVIDSEGRLDRRALRALVFADESERRWLESVTHPRIRQRLEHYLADMRASGGPYHLLVSPLLFESGQHKLVDRCLIIDVPEALQISRTVGRDTVEEAQVKAIIRAQMPRTERLARADDVIDNQGSHDDLARQVAELDRRYRQLAASTPA
ncbi:dephospho-CoA kinase [Modicisalibacter luteus]|uniref:Dephospho-CoA kinase n=1 Tax=Modicisalibacter luteus TaxID=453962 RepID=A0ABV7M163_9GAMM|nr:dephospho-CoA kinase [Halomonas lutea]GHA90939.1 dephospho-CoA kinase [Halomonas lutea]